VQVGATTSIGTVGKGSGIGLNASLGGGAGGSVSIG
jgi:hypothetical protein